MMKIDESIIFLKQGDAPISTLQGWVHRCNIVCIYMYVNEYFLQGKRQKVSIP